MAIPGSEYLACFEDWKKRWHKGNLFGGAYYEGEEISLEK